MNLKRSYILFFAVSIVVSSPHMRAAGGKEESRLTRAMNVLRTDKRVKVCAAVGAVVSAAALYYVLTKDEQPESFDVNPNDVVAPQELKNQYQRAGMVVIDRTRMSAATIVYLQESNYVKKSTIGESSYEITNVWAILDYIAVSNAKIGPLSRLATDLDRIIALLKKQQ
jgi:hypothetical protein